MSNIYTLSKHDKEVIEVIQNRSNVIRFLKNIKNNKFNIGDILNMQHTSYDNSEWLTQMVSDKTMVPVKYIYVYEDDLGVGYVKRYNADCSSLQDTIISLAELDLENVRFIVDPDYADHILLGGDTTFDASEKYSEAKKKRERVRRMNEKIAISGTNGEILSSFKKGDKFWFDHDLSCLNPREYEVIKITKPTKDSWEYSYGLKIDTKCLSDTNYNISFYTSNSSGYFFKTKPCLLKEQL